MTTIDHQGLRKSLICFWYFDFCINSVFIQVERLSANAEEIKKKTSMKSTKYVIHVASLQHMYERMNRCLDIDLFVSGFLYLKIWTAFSVWCMSVVKQFVLNVIFVFMVKALGTKPFPKLKPPSTRNLTRGHWIWMQAFNRVTLHAF